MSSNMSAFKNSTFHQINCFPKIFPKFGEYSPNLGYIILGYILGHFFGAFFGIYFCGISAIPIGRRAKIPQDLFSGNAPKMPQKCTFEENWLAP